MASVSKNLLRLICHLTKKYNQTKPTDWHLPIVYRSIYSNHTLSQPRFLHQSIYIINSLSVSSSSTWVIFHSFSFISSGSSYFLPLPPFFLYTCLASVFLPFLSFGLSVYLSFIIPFFFFILYKSGSLTLLEGKHKNNPRTFLNRVTILVIS